MSPLLLQVLAVSTLVAAEALAVYAEVLAACVQTERGSVASQLLSAGGLMAIAGVLLLAGYHYTYRAFGDLWTVGVISITVILIAEPIITFCMAGTLPGRGATLGLILGALGLVVALVVP